MTNRTTWPDRAALVAIWLFATALTITKAFHIDDTAHLEIARWILQQPLHPMQGLVNWDQNAAPIHALNQPPLYFYLLALWGGIWGFGEVPMHLLGSLFTLLAILLTHALCRRLVPERALLTTALLTLSPAFVVGQNLMVDVPLLACWLAVAWCLLAPHGPEGRQRAGAAGLLIGIACLIKYTSLALIPAFALFLATEPRGEAPRRRWLARFWPLLLPIGLLALWSAFNLADYGGIHLLERTSGKLSAPDIGLRCVSYLVCLGAIVPYGPLLVNWHRCRALGRGRAGLLAIALAAGLVVYLQALNKNLSPVEHLIGALSLLNGGLVFGLFIASCWRRGLPLLQQGRPERFLYLWAGAAIGFTVLLAPFIATRHVLLALPPLTLVLMRDLAEARPVARRWEAWFLLPAGLLSLGLGLADWHWADHYRRGAPWAMAALPRGARVVFSGHWGWQWYARKAGMEPLELQPPNLRAGDYLVHPAAVHSQNLERLPKHLSLREVARYPAQRLPFPALSSRGASASFYQSGLHPPWTLSKEVAPPILIYRVVPRVQ